MEIATSQNLSSLTFGVAMELGHSGIQMDIGKAMNILGFPPHQLFEQTSIDEISNAFLIQTKRVMKKRQEAMKNSKVTKVYKFKIHS